MARIMIAGCGDIGAAAGRLLAAEGHDIVGLKRRPPSEEGDIRYIKADLTCIDDFENLDTDFDLVIYILSPGERSEQAYRNVFEHGVANLLTHFSQSSASPRFIFVSSTSVYSQAGGEWVDEESVTEPANFSGRLILQAEQDFLSHGSGNCVIRFSGIYGRNRSYLLDMVARGGQVQYQPPYFTNRIHRDDCIAVLHFISRRMIAGTELDPVYLASDDDPAPKWEVYNYLSARLGVTAPEKAVLPLDSDQNKRCSNRRLKQLGYRFIYKSYRDGYAFIDEAGS